MPTVEDPIRRRLEAYSRIVVKIADELCDRHPPDRVAVRYPLVRGETGRLTYQELRERSAVFGGLLSELGVEAGDRVATLLPKSLELVVATLGIWRLGAVHVPLFTAFGSDAIRYRMSDAQARVIVTDDANRQKIPQGPYTIVTHGKTSDQDISFEKSASPLRESIQRSPDDLLILIYTSGTTGNAKGVEVPVKALASFEMYMRCGLDVHDDDVHWNVADPGWAYGLYYGLVGTLLLGQTILYHKGAFDPDVVLTILREEGVTNLAAAPTAYRALRAAHVRGHGLSLRVASSAGEPLNPDLIAWAEEHLGVPIHDHYGQTELGMVVVNPHEPALLRPLRPGSMGHPAPGFRVVVVDEAGEELPPRHEGQVAVDTTASPLFWFRGYHGAPERTSERFAGNNRYYLTGDTGSVDDDGYFFFSSRADDVITSAGYRIGPFEVESALMSHIAVGEAAAVGVPDELRGQVVKAYVVLRTGHDASETLRGELQQHVRSTLAAHAYPREIEFINVLPRTPSGKIQRFLLRNQ